MADSAAQNLAESMMSGWDSITKEFLTSWLDVGLLVDLDAGSVTWLTAQLETISAFLAVIGLMVAAIWTVLHHRGEKAVKVVKALFTVVLVSTLGVGLIQVVLAGGDSFSDWILDSAGITTDARAQIPVAGLVAASPGLAILAGVFGIIATIIQWGIMLVRSALIPLLVGVWPTAAAASMIGGGSQAFSKITTWIIAFALYKPIAAIVYAYAWKTKSGEDGIGGAINGLVLIVLAVVALPAMMRLLAPGTAALGSSAGGSMALAGAAALAGAGVAAGTAVLSGGGTAMASGAAKSPGMGRTAGLVPSTAGGTGRSGPTSTGGSPEDGSPPSGGPSSGSPLSGDSGPATDTPPDDAGPAGTGITVPASGSGRTGSQPTGRNTTVSPAESGHNRPPTPVGTTGTSSGTASEANQGSPTRENQTTGNQHDTRGSQLPNTAGSESSSIPAQTPAGSSPVAGAPTTPPTFSPSSTTGTTPAREAKTAAVQSLTQAVANGAAEADGRDVVGP
ncbi:hypothetical protein [Paeniglutamicibacter cryotolerans]|uniref:TrbL/VirB6 plasmid conjugal transfer protein n=1 Tax=Paeniglutamicibacter cryotolerans TaxID=670079 RepID=A0A839QS97_9MICC|nr:hypothetical protein [Paeniglutamicibacter cryotolerans]MBB2997555.1 hypothetical protein [Paeniglutamicibacter cryotolerans]